MTTLSFGSEDVKLGEALYRSAGHCFAACELYSSGRPHDALLQAARPMTDVLPWLETEARSNTAELAAFIKSVARVGAEVRRSARPASVRKAFIVVEKAVENLVEAALGRRSRSAAYDAAVALELLESTRQSFGRGIASGNVGDYQSAYAIAREAFRLLDSVRAERVAGTDEHLAVLRAAFPGIEPSERLVRPETVGRAVDGLNRVLGEAFKLYSPPLQELDEGLVKVERLLDDTVAAHADGVPALAARLAASLFIRSYDPIREKVAARDAAAEERLSQLLGIEVRTAINRGVSVKELDGLRREAKQLIRASRTL